MPSLMRPIVACCIALSLSGCGNRMFSPRPTNPVIEDRVRAGGSKGPKMSVLSTRADRRTILIMAPDRICAEPPPDVAEALNAQLKLDLETKGVKLGAGSSLQTAIQQLTRRSQGLELFRTSAFVYCNMYLNKQITPAEYTSKVDNAFKEAVGLIRDEMENLPQLADALQVVGAAELKLQSQRLPETPDNAAAPAQ